MAGVVDRARVEIKLGTYGVAPAAALADPSLHPRVQDYRRQAAARMVALDRRDIRVRIPTAAYHVSRKIDGEFTVLVYREGEAFSLNPGGTVRVGLPWMDEAAQWLKRAGVREALVAGELYVARDEGRPRVQDVSTVARQPSGPQDLDRLRFAVFDLISLDNKVPGDYFAETWNRIERLFGQGQAVHPVESRQAQDSDAIERLFHQWVEEQGAEGLVVRSDTAGTFKIKQRQTLDAAVIGFTEGTDERQGLLHDLLVAVMRGDETFHVLTRVGGGFSDDERRAMLGDLKDMTAASEYAEVNADHIAYQMVEPQWVVELSCLDLISQTTSGGPIQRMVLDWSGNGSRGYHVVRRLPLVSVISPQFLRRREDKRICQSDLRIQQLTDLVEVPLADRDARRETLPRSEILRREVYTKQLKGETMVRKFVLWKTNKETASDEFPAFVAHYTDFSPNRKTPLDRELRVSNSREQIDLLWDGLKTSNLAKGWELRAATTAEERPLVEVPVLPAPVPAVPVAEPVAKPAKKPAKKEEFVAPIEVEATGEAEAPKMAPSERTTTKKAARKKKTG